MGEPSPRERHITDDWRSRSLARFQTKAGRVWLVKLLETKLTGTEVPPEITEAIDHAVEAERSRTPDCPALGSTAYALDTYRAIVQELKSKGKLS